MYWRKVLYSYLRVSPGPSDYGHPEDGVLKVLRARSWGCNLLVVVIAVLVLLRCVAMMATTAHAPAVTEPAGWD